MGEAGEAAGLPFTGDGHNILPTMANKTIEELQAELEAVRMEADGHKKAAEDARKAADAMQAVLASAKKDGKVSLPVPGSYDAKWQDASGKKQSRKVEFKDGRLRVVLPKIGGMEQYAGMYAASESLLLLANGEKAKDEHLSQNPVLASMNQEQAAAVLTHFAGINAGFLK